MTPKEFAKKIIASINPGTADISGIGDGTIKGAISELNSNIGNEFSTHEIKTNDTWIDGKSLYRKTFEIGTLPNATTKTHLHNIDNVDTIFIDISHSYAYNASGVFYPILNAATGDVKQQWYATVNRTEITTGAGYDRSSFQAVITLLYTKTTD